MLDAPCAVMRPFASCAAPPSAGPSDGGGAATLRGDQARHSPLQRHKKYANFDNVTHCIVLHSIRSPKMRRHASQRRCTLPLRPRCVYPASNTLAAHEFMLLVPVLVRARCQDPSKHVGSPLFGLYFSRVGFGSRGLQMEPTEGREKAKLLSPKLIL